MTKGELVQGTILVTGHATFTLFDCGASHYFIASRFASSLPMSAVLLNYPSKVHTPTGDQSLCTLYIPSVEVSVASQNLPADLILLDMTEFDVILGMDWLFEYHAQVLCKEGKVVLYPPDRPVFEISLARPI